MTNIENRQEVASSSQIVDAWWDGDHSAPLEVPLDQAPCICESLLPRSRQDVALILRCLLMSLVNHLPFSCLKIMFARMAGMRIGKGVYVSPYVLLDPLYPQLIELEDGALLGIGCRLLTHEYTASRFRLGRVRVDKGAVIGAFSTIRSGVTIGAGATVGMHSFVNRDVKLSDTVGGVPARSLKRQEHD